MLIYKESIKVATELIEQCYLDKRNKQILFRPTLDFEEFHYPIFNAVQPSLDSFGWPALRTTTVKAIAEFYGYDNLKEFWSMVVCSFVDYIKKNGINEASALLLHLKDMFIRYEEHYFEITEPLKDVHLSIIKSDFEEKQKLIKETPDPKLDIFSKELYMKYIYLFVYYGAHLFLKLKEHDEKFESTHCEAFGIVAEEYEEHIETIFSWIYQNVFLLNIAGIKISALTLCMNSHLIPEATDDVFSLSFPGDNGDNGDNGDVRDNDEYEWRTTSKFEHFKSPEFQASNNPFIIKKGGRPNESTFQKKEFIELVRRLAADKDYQYPNGAPVPTRIRDEIHLGDYKEKGLLKATRLFTKVKQALEIIEKENRIKDQKGDSGGTGNLDGE